MGNLEYVTVGYATSGGDWLCRRCASDQELDSMEQLVEDLQQQLVAWKQRMGWWKNLVELIFNALPKRDISAFLRLEK